jgi:hypothetical protein
MWRRVRRIDRTPSCSQGVCDPGRWEPAAASAGCCTVARVLEGIALHIPRPLLTVAPLHRCWGDNTTPPPNHEEYAAAPCPASRTPTRFPPVPAPPHGPGGPGQPAPAIPVGPGHSLTAWLAHCAARCSAMISSLAGRSPAAIGLCRRRGAPGRGKLTIPVEPWASSTRCLALESAASACLSASIWHRPRSMISGRARDSSTVVLAPCPAALDDPPPLPERVQDADVRT